MDGTLQAFLLYSEYITPCPRGRTLQEEEGGSSPWFGFYSCCRLCEETFSAAVPASCSACRVARWLCNPSLWLAWGWHHAIQALHWQWYSDSTHLPTSLISPTPRGLFLVAQQPWTSSRPGSPANLSAIPWATTMTSPMKSEPPLWRGAPSKLVLVWVQFSLSLRYPLWVQYYYPQFSHEKPRFKGVQSFAWGHTAEKVRSRASL